jgi:hypothetical protein
MGEISKVQIRKGFSDRNNINKLNETMQIDSFDRRTRIQLYNYFTYIIENNRQYAIDRETFYLDVLYNVYCEVIDNYDKYSIKEYIETCKGYIKDTFLRDSYDAVLSLVEYLTNKIDSEIPQYAKKFELDFDGSMKRVCFQEEVNKLFEKECVGYRFVGEEIVAITSKVEIKEIEESLQSNYDGCREHIKKAVGFLADREQKDYKNCIKESISAVESICCIITDKKNATLGETLKLLESKCNLKGQMKSAFEKLYAYTNSDKGGIRHAEGLFVSEVSFEEAKFMLVSCSAFVNYLTAEYGKIKKD